MKSDIKDLTEGSLWSGILIFSIPLILSNLLQILFNMSDIAVIGRFAGPAALGSVGSTTTLVMMFTGFLMGMGGGVNVLTARFFGQDHPEEIRSAVHTSFLISLAAGMLLLLIGEVFCKGILLLLRTKEELLPGAVLYLRIYFLGMPALAVYNFGQAVFSAAGNTRKPLMFLLVSGILNVLLNLFFVLVMGMDVEGVAIASILAQYVSAACIMAALVRVRGPHAFRPSALKADPDKVRSVLSIGFPAGLQNMIFSLANLFVQFGVNSFSAAMVAGNAAAQNADGLAYDVMAAFYTACGSFMGQNYGAGKRERVLKSYTVSLVCSFGAGALIGGTLVLMGEHFLGIFTSDPEVVAGGMYRLRIMGASYAFSAFMDCTIAGSRALGRGAVPTVIVLLGSCVFRVLWVMTVFAYFHTVTSLYLLYICSWAITAVAELVYFRGILRKLLPAQ